MFRSWRASAWIWTGASGVKQQKIGALKSELAAIAKDLEQKSKDRSRAQVNDEIEAKARSRSDLVQKVKRALEAILKIREEDMRKRLGRRVEDDLR